ncbi:hypothetical protein [Pseudomonas sp. NPDC099000]|uniref:hypothetical protein n=1 Tax=Pseudomonas sp. NPDC099000 TaxID=3364488 RepID=UPI003839E3F7
MADSLDGDIYQQSVLDPEVFVRYNDPLLQSCIWRAASPSELDYSSDEILSGQFVDILFRLLEHHNNEKGEASIDLLIGISIEKIKVSRKSIRRINKKVRELASTNGHLAPLSTKFEILSE